MTLRSQILNILASNPNSTARDLARKIGEARGMTQRVGSVTDELTKMKREGTVTAAPSVYRGRVPVYQLTTPAAANA